VAPRSPRIDLALGPIARALGALAIVAAGCKPQSKPPVTLPSQDAGAVDVAAPDAAAPPETGTATQPSQLVTWTCTGNPCPWGSSQSNHAVVWPASARALATRLGYTVSAAIYLPAAQANGADLAIETGTATVHAGLPSAVSHRVLATLKAGESFRVSAVASGEVVSVQGDAPFRYRATLHPAAPPDQPPRRPPGSGGGRLVRSIAARWRCNKVPGCFSDPWTGAVIAWPEGTANQSNGRPGNVSRSVFSVAGEPLYPYMGAWAEGCDVTAESGIVQVVEWQHGAEQWRSTTLHPGESNVIHLVPPENGALIEAAEGVNRFSVTLRDCTPQRIQP